MPRLAAVAFAASLGFVSAAALADETMPPQENYVPQQTAQTPAGSPAASTPFNPNAVSPSSPLRSGSGAVLDPNSTLPDNYHVEHDYGG